MSGESPSARAKGGIATRAAILQAAADTFAERGFNSASLREVAKRAGITHAGLLHHYRGKDELLSAVLVEQDAQTEARGAPELADPHIGPGALMRFLARSVRDRQRTPELVLLRTELTAMAARPSHPAHMYLKDRNERRREALEKNFHARAETGTLRQGVDPQMAAALWLAVGDGLFLQWSLDDSCDIVRSLDQFVRLLFVDIPPRTDACQPLARHAARGPTLGITPTQPFSSGSQEAAAPAPPAACRAARLPVIGARRATIKDVAHEAGVSVSAVSKVLRSAYGVSPQMRATVTRTIERIGYRPHAGARGMRGRSYTVGIAVPGLASPFSAQVAASVSRALDATPYQSILVTGFEPDQHRRSIETLLDRQVDGLILITPWLETAWLEDIGARVPMVVTSRHGGANNFDTVVNDDYAGARLMVDHLVGLGHRRILHTSQPSGGLVRPHVLSHIARCDGYVQSMRSHGLEPDIILTSYSEEGGFDAAVQALARPEPPTAIFAGADIAALGVLRAADEYDLAVSEDLTVTGYDNIDMSSIGRVSLTTIDQPADLMGTMAADLLLERLNGRTAPIHHVINPRLVPRRTSAAPHRQPAGQ